jgi:hypothetical protein
MPEVRRRPIAYDVVLHRPGCALLQAALGCGGEGNLSNRFPSELWLLAPTPNLRVYLISDEDLEKLVQISIRKNKNEKAR